MMKYIIEINERFNIDEENVKGQTYFWANWDFRNMFESISDRHNDVFSTQASGFDNNSNEQQTALIASKNGITAAWVLWNEIRRAN